MPPVSAFKLLLTALAAAFTLQIPSPAGSQTPAADADFRFLLSAVTKGVRDGRPRVVPLEDGMTLHSGDLVKFYAEFEQEGYLYVFHEDSRGTLTFLFPREPGRAAVKARTPVFVPEGGGWIELDPHPGRETFHLLVSAARRVRLEKLCADLRPPAEEAARMRASRSILAEIRSVAGGSLDRQAEKPLRIAGKLRGGAEAGAAAPPELFSSAVALATRGSYLKTITLVHD